MYVNRRVIAFVLRRVARATALVFVAASAALLLARLAPGDHLSAFDTDPQVVAAERHRLGLDRPLLQQYLAWFGRVVQLDWGESTAHTGRSVSGLVAERAWLSAILGLLALVIATSLGIPLGIFTGAQPDRLLARAGRGLSIVLLATPPIALALSLLLLAARTGWLPVGGAPASADGLASLRHFTLPVLALALPIAAALERLQSRAIAAALSDPAILAARARGLSAERVLWRHALTLSLKPVLGVYGVVIGALISGSFVVEYVMTWPGLAQLMFEALRNRDANLVAACAATGAAFLAFGILLSDLLLAAIDPRVELS